MKIRAIGFIALTVVSFASFSATKEQLDEIRKEKIDYMADTIIQSTKDIFNSDRAHAIKDLVVDTGNNAKNAVFKPGTYCETMQRNSDKIVAAEWFSVETGEVLADYARQRDQLAQELVTLWSKDKIKEFSPNLDVLNEDTQIDTSEFRFYESSGIANFPTYWTKFWEKRLTKGAGTYRCFRDEHTVDIQMKELISRTGDFMESKGYTTWHSDFQKLTSSFE
tara:strand:+ start:1097 stop:1762 length:666 start_codon:yes stop_codon:yes gene_type:complete